MASRPGVDDIKTIRKQLKQGRAGALSKLEASVNIPNPDHCLSNTDLLLDVIESLLQDVHRFSYLPTTITSHLLRELQELKNAMPDPNVKDGWAEKPSDVLGALLSRFDALYAYCLQYGIVSFGFTPKLAQEQVDAIRASVKSAESITTEFARTLTDMKGEADTQAQELVESVRESHDRHLLAMQTDLDAIGENAKAVTAELSEAVTRGSEISGVLTQAQLALEQIATTKTDVDSTSASVAEEKTRTMTVVESLLQSVQTADNQVKEHAANAKVLEQSMTESKATANSHLEEITKFYGDIEVHQQQMLVTRKESQASFNALKEETDKALNDCSERTASIVTVNENLLGQIKEHLSKAVGASLFSAFDKRRGRVFGGTILWGILLFLATGGALWFAIWFVASIEEVLKDPKVEIPMLFARLVIAAPIAFLITFCARQYGRERRVGEEYAFKSAISVSLEPYRDMLVRMQKDNPEVATEFVRTLMLEVFDNPAKRLYSKAKSTKNPEDDDPYMETIVKIVLDRLQAGS